MFNLVLSGLLKQLTETHLLKRLQKAKCLVGEVSIGNYTVVHGHARKKKLYVSGVYDTKENFTSLISHHIQVPLFLNSFKLRLL